MNNDRPRPDFSEFADQDAAFGRKIFFSLMLVCLVLVVSLAIPHLREMFGG